jgi:hypothetical protein
MMTGFALLIVSRPLAELSSVSSKRRAALPVHVIANDQIAGQPLSMSSVWNS